VGGVAAFQRMIPRLGPSGTRPAPPAALRERSGQARYATMSTPLEPRVRRATVTDASVLAELRFAFRSSLVVPVETREEFLSRCTIWMRSQLADESRWRAWILESDDAPIGAVWLQIIEKLPNPGLERELHAYVTNLFVRPEHRGRGGGGMLLATLLAACVGIGIDTVFLWPTAESRPLYTRHGFSVTESVMVRVL
jgi:GNAT superfamily N-acetyltransferase